MAPVSRECPYVQAFIQLMDSTSTATLSHRTGAWRLIPRPHDKRRKWPAP